MGALLGNVLSSILDSNSQDPTLQSARNNQQNLFTQIVNRYVPGLKTKPAGSGNAPETGAHYSNTNSVPARSNYDANVPGIASPREPDPSNPMDPNYYEEAGAQGPDMQGGIPNQNQWQSDPSGGALQGGGGLVGAGIRTGLQAAVGLADGSTLVTKPTIAKIGERGPEMVVPLQARAGNRVQPDVLEGHVSAPKVPGVRYSRYKSFTDRAL